MLIQISEDAYVDHKSICGQIKLHESLNFSIIDEYLIFKNLTFKYH